MEVQLETEVDEAYLAEHDCDVVIVATGSRPSAPPFPSDSSVPVLSTDEAMYAVVEGPARRVVVADTLGTDEPAVVVEALATAGWQVVIASAGPIGAFMGATHALDHIPRLLALGCVIEERCVVTCVEGRDVVVRSVLTGSMIKHETDLLVHAATRVAEHRVAALARELGRKVVLAGDCDAPRDAMFAFLGGNDAGRHA